MICFLVNDSDCHTSRVFQETEKTISDIFVLTLFHSTVAFIRFNLYPQFLSNVFVSLML